MHRSGTVLALALVLAGCSSNSKSPSASFSIPASSQVLGSWRVVNVNGDQAAPESGALLSMVRTRGEYLATWSDGVNDHSQQWFLTNGKIRWGDGSVTSRACAGTGQHPCLSLTAFGVGTAETVKMTKEGDLVFMDQAPTPLAIYKRVFKDAP